MLQEDGVTSTSVKSKGNITMGFINQVENHPNHTCIVDGAICRLTSRIFRKWTCLGRIILEWGAKAGESKSDIDA